ncbi:MAG TPA: NAD(P)-dependent oxidoreductase [Pyrinomonadaceae bacterium]|nr:NAD(P)-dependent oxidoreductase [Pyrinomonadaceae bacterium]
MRILVTGGSGYLGMHVRRFFNADDFSRRSHLDLLNPHDAKLIGNYDAVIHLAAHLDKDPAAAESCFRTNAEGTANVIRNMQNGSVLIYASTKDVYGSNAGAYAEVPETCSTSYCGQSALEWSKLMGEHYIHYYAEGRNIRTCIFRLSSIYARPSEGNESGFVTHYVEAVKRGWPIKLPLSGAPVRDLLHVDDFSRACRAFIDSPRTRGLYNLGGGRNNALSLREIISTVGRMIEREPVIDHEARLPPPVPVNYVSNLSRVREELDWEPTVYVEEGLRSLL